jgi:hypothetical protein
VNFVRVPEAYQLSQKKHSVALKSPTPKHSNFSRLHFTAISNAEKKAQELQEQSIDASVNESQIDYPNDRNIFETI